MSDQTTAYTNNAYIQINNNKMSLSSEAKKRLHESLQQQCLNQKSAEYNEAKRLFIGLTDLDYKTWP